MHRPIKLLLCLAWLPFTAFAETASTTPTQHPKIDFNKDISPILDRYCLRCHGPKKQKGNFRIDKLNPDIIKGMDADHWYEVLDNINVGEMPPEDVKQLKDDERVKLVEWLTKELKHAAVAKRGEAKSVIRRLNKVQYTNNAHVGSRHFPRWR